MRGSIIISIKCQLRNVILIIINFYIVIGSFIKSSNSYFTLNNNRMDEMKNTPYYKAIYMDKMYPCANYPLKKPKNVESDVPPSFLPSFSHLGLTTAFHAEEPPVNKPDGKLTESYVADSVTRLRGKIRAVRAINPHPNLFIDRNYDLMNQVCTELLTCHILICR